MRIIKWPKWYVYLAWSFVAAFLIYHTLNDGDFIRETYDNDVSKNIPPSVIIDKYVDKNNHNYKVIGFKGDQFSDSLILNLDKSGLFDYVSIGDSIIKVPGDSSVLVTRDGNAKVFVLRY